MCTAGYIGEFEYVDDHRAGKIVVELNGRWASFCLSALHHSQTCRLMWCACHHSSTWELNDKYLCAG